MRVGLLIYGSLDTVSGGYLYDRKLVEHLTHHGDEVKIISLPWRNYGRHLMDNWSEDLYRRLVDADLDVLLQDELNHPSLFRVNARLRRRSTYPIISVVHHLRCDEQRPAWQNGIIRLIERGYLNSVDGFILNSVTTRRAVSAVIGRDVGEKALSVVAHPAGDHVHPSMSDEKITSRALAPGPLRIVFVGNVIRRKGLQDLVEAMARLPRGDCCLSVVGNRLADVAYAKTVEALVVRLDLAPFVRFLGPLPHTDLTAVLADSHVLAIPSTYEGFGIAYLEGMGFGLPAIATTAGAAHEIITPGENGVLVPPHDPHTLAAHLTRLSTDRQLLARMGLAARRRFLSHPTWSQSMERVRAALRQLLSPSSGSS